MNISVVIPTHDRDDLLTDAIASVLTQTLPPAELLVCDDVGSESTRSLVEQWGERSGGVVRYVDSSGPDSGTAGASRNVGARLARGDVLAFLDDDDLWLPSHLARLVDALRTRGADFAVAWTEADDPDFVFARMVDGLGARDVLSRNPGFVGSNFAITVEAFSAVGGFDPELRVSNDQDLLVRLLNNGARYVALPEVSVCNRIHSVGQLTDKTERRAQGVLRYYAKHSHQMTWFDKLWIGTIVAGIRRKSSSAATLRLLYTALTAAGKLTILATRWLHR